MSPHYTYLLILAGALLFPLALSFDKKVAFYKSWRYVFGAMLLPAAFYIVWDVWFTSIKVWSFNPAYVIGIHVANLPLEEVLFFFIVPYCCTFIYACVRAWFPRLLSGRVSEAILFFTGLAVFIVAVIFHHFQYSFYTGIFLAAFIFLIFIFRAQISSFNSAAFLVSFALVLLPFLVVNGILTALPVVIYNNAQNLSLRIMTIPAEDIFYGMLLMLMNVCIYDKLRESSYHSSGK